MHKTVLAFPGRPYTHVVASRKQVAGQFSRGKSNARHNQFVCPSLLHNACSMNFMGIYVSPAVVLTLIFRAFVPGSEGQTCKCLRLFVRVCPQLLVAAFDGHTTFKQLSARKAQHVRA